MRIIVAQGRVTNLAPIVAFHHKLVGTRNQVESICMIELLCNILTKSVTGTTRRDTPTTAIIWI